MYVCVCVRACEWVFLMSSTDRLFRFITTLQYDWINEMLEAWIETPADFTSVGYLTLKLS